MARILARASRYPRGVKSAGASRPLVSIILCTYQQAEYVRDAVDSVLAQTYRPIELILIDNGSTDGTPDIVAPYAADPRVRLFAYPKNGPVTQRLNAGIASSSGEAVSFVFGDDLYLADKTERQMRVLGGLGPDYGVVYGPGYRLNMRSGQRWLPRTYSRSGDVGRDLVLGFHSASLDPIAPLIRRRCLVENPFHEDVFLEGTESVLLRIALSYKFQYLGEPLTVMREHPRNRGKAYATNTELNLVLLDKLAHEPAFPADLRPAITSIKATALRSLAWATLRIRCDGAEARGYLRRAIALEPRQALHPRSMAAWLLSFLPRGSLRVLNRAATVVRRHRTGLEFLESHS